MNRKHIIALVSIMFISSLAVAYAAFSATVNHNVTIVRGPGLSIVRVNYTISGNGVTNPSLSCSGSGDSWTCPSDNVWPGSLLNYSILFANLGTADSIVTGQASSSGTAASCSGEFSTHGSPTTTVRADQDGTLFVAVDVSTSAVIGDTCKLTVTITGT